MNSDILTMQEQQLTPRRAFDKPWRILGMKRLNNSHYLNGKIYGCSSNEKQLCVLDESSLRVDVETTIEGPHPVYVSESEMLFRLSKKSCALVDTSTLTLKSTPFDTELNLLPIYRINNECVLFTFLKPLSCYAVYEWPAMTMVWEHISPRKLITQGEVVCLKHIYSYHSKGLRKLDLATGDIVWSKSIEDWSSHPIFKDKKIASIDVRTERTGIFADTLVLALTGQVILGIDIHSGEVRWALDIAGNQTTRITADGKAWFVRTEGIYSIDVAEGKLLPLIPIQYSPVLERVQSAQLGGWDMSTTQIIAEVSARTGKGYTEGHIVGINLISGIVEWGVPIKGTVTKLMLLNNRVYVTGMLATADNPEAGFSDLVIEGEGGYIPD